MRGNITEVITHLKGMVPELARREHILIARKGLERVKAKSPGIPYRIIVDGKAAFTEQQVKPFGVIKYVFIRLPQIARFAYQTAMDLSPVDSGRYKRSWMFIIDGRPVFSMIDIPHTAERITVVNFQPYSRKVNVRKEYGTGKVSVPPGVVEKTRQIVSRKYSSQVNLNVEYIELSQGYVLKHNYVQTMARHGRNRIHTHAGRQITYPALVITPKR